MTSRWLCTLATVALLSGWALAQTDISVENTGVVTRPMVAGQALPETHNVHTILWTDDNRVSGESYNIYVSDQPITDVGAANVYRIGTQIPEGQQAYEHALLTPFAPGVVTNYYAVTQVSSTGLEDPKITPGANATTNSTSGTTEFGQPIWWFTEEPVIDAEFGDWAPFKPLYLSPNLRSVENGTSDGPQDQSGYVGMGINDTDLFFLGEITDDALVNVNPTGSGDIWQGDNGEYYIGFYDLRPSTSRHPETQWGNATDPTKAEPDWQLNIAGNAFSDPNRSQNYAAGKHGSFQTGMGNLGLEVLTKETAKGWNLEARQPLVGLAQDPKVIAPFRPKIGMVLPSNIALEDGDDPAGGRQAQLFWAKDTATNNSWSTPSVWEKEQVIYDPKVFGLGGDGSPTARFATSPPSLGFDNTEVGSTLQKTLTVSNTGTAELVITGMSIQGPDVARFQVSPRTANIAPGGSQTVTVTFTQGMAGTKSATLSISHNGRGSPAGVALAGASPTLKLSVGNATGLRKGLVTVPIAVDNALGIAGGELTVTYDANVLTAKQAKGTELLSGAGMTVVSNLTTGGQVKVSMAGAAGIKSGSGALVNVEFEIKSTAPVGSTALRLQAKLVDENGKTYTSTAGSGSVTVAVLGDVNADGEVNAGDAVLVLRYSAGLILLSDAQKDMGDVNGDKALNSADAILLLRKLAGLITKFPREGAGKLVVSSPLGAAVQLGRMRVLDPSSVEVPVVLSAGVGGGDLLLRYEGSACAVAGVSGPEGVLVATNAVKGGELRLSVARAEAFAPVVVLVRLAGPAPQSVQLTGQAFSVDGEALLSVGSRPAQPLTGSLSGYPNPFNASTTLRYELVDAGEVQLLIYDVSGAVVRRLVSGWQAAGAYSVPWDGRDEGGQPVASGLYLGCLEAGRMRQVHKLMLLK
jgi:hypothetical protein